MWTPWGLIKDEISEQAVNNMKCLIHSHLRWEVQLEDLNLRLMIKLENGYVATERDREADKVRTSSLILLDGEKVLIGTQ